MQGFENFSAMTDFGDLVEVDPHEAFKDKEMEDEMALAFCEVPPEMKSGPIFNRKRKRASLKIKAKNANKPKTKRRKLGSLKVPKEKKKSKKIFGEKFSKLSKLVGLKSIQGLTDARRNPTAGQVVM